MYGHGINMLALNQKMANNALVRTLTTLRFVCAAQLERYKHSKLGGN